MSASADFTRIVSLVAELTRDERAGAGLSTLDDLAARHGVTEEVVNADLRALTLLGDHAEADWLLSLRVWQQDRHVSVSSGGPFRRPVRLSPEEQLAIQVALVLDPQGQALAARLAALWAGDRVPPSAATHGADDPAAIARQAVRRHVELVMTYSGEGEREAREWLLHPHQIAEVKDRRYLVAWASEVGEWRHFRLDRVLAARLRDVRFEPRADFVPLTRPEDVYRPGPDVDVVRVRFAAPVAGWVAERYPDHEMDSDGSIVVRFRTTSPEWLSRRVLEYGGDAEVLDPARYRDAMRAAVAG